MIPPARRRVRRPPGESFFYTMEAQVELKPVCFATRRPMKEDDVLRELSLHPDGARSVEIARRLKRPVMLVHDAIKRLAADGRVGLVRDGGCARWFLDV